MSITTARGINFSNVECWCFTKEQAHDYWGLVSPFLARWIDATHGELNVDDVYRMACEGLMQIFVFHAAGDIALVAVTEFVQYPRMKVLRIVGMAGAKPILAQKFMPQVESWAMENGAQALETFATPETVKLDMRLGMKPLYTLMRKPLERKD
jgi:hypothetical protein